MSVFDFRRGTFGSNLKTGTWDVSSLPKFEKDFYRESPTVASRSQADIKKFQEENEITTTGQNIPNPILHFKEGNFPHYVLSQIRKNKWRKPTAIQSMAWPIGLSGRNLVGIAQTGSGKTLGFMLPAIVHVNNQPLLEDGDGPMVLVLVPTRELASQVQDVAKEFGKSSNVRSICVYGGVPKEPQMVNIRIGAEICIATPGRLIDFLEGGEISMKRVTYLVLDEADRMLDMGFEPQIRMVLEQIRPDRQLLMFSATWPDAVRKLADEFLGDSVQVSMNKGSLTSNRNIEQIVDVCKEWDKEEKLVNLLNDILKQKENKTIIFVESKIKVDDISRRMSKDGWPINCIHGDKSQTERESALNGFRNGSKPILIATDVASRGLDINDVKFVINYDYPVGLEDYTHRIGRTGRAGSTGTAYTFFTDKNVIQAKDLIKVLQDNNQEVDSKLLEMGEKCQRIEEKRARFEEKRSQQGGSGGRGGGRGGSRGGGGWKGHKGRRGGGHSRGGFGSKRK